MATTITYRVYADDFVIDSFELEGDAITRVKQEAMIRKKAYFIIERVEMVFDSYSNPDHAALIYRTRHPNRDNAIHASIHASDRNIGADDDEERQ